MTTALQPPSPPPPLPPPPTLLRLSLAPRGALPRAIDGAWWPRSYDLLTELPDLLAGLPRTWGHIGSVTVKGAVWSTLPSRMLVANQVVRLNSCLSASAPPTVVLLAAGRGRWDLLVVPPDTSAEAAGALMAAAATGLTAGR